MAVKRVSVDDEAAHAVRRGRPWVYREALHEPPRAPAGAVVDVVDRRGAFAGRGLYDPGVPIAVRVLTRDPGEAVGPPLLAGRLRAAHDLSRRLVELGNLEAWRLCNGEGDHLPGLVVDVYGEYAVVDLATAAWGPLREAVCACLADLLTPRGIAEKSRLKPGRGGEVVRQLWGEEPPEELLVREGPARFAVHVRGTAKTGLFLDQRETRAALRRYAGGAEVLNAFAFTGSLSVAAAQGAAARVVSLDLSGPALAWARRNFEVNHFDPAAHEWIQGDAFEVLPAFGRRGRHFDLVVLDPPGFAASKKRVFQAERDWAELAALGIGVLRPGGLLVASSPMAALSVAAMERALCDGALRAGARLRVFDLRSQPPDHPVDPACPERRYLKVFFAVR
jgi:23S rRNA (cytosine1962-C5)-methyltransferase